MISLIKCCTKDIQSIPAVRFVSLVLNYASNKILFCVRYKDVPLEHAISQNIVASFFIASISPLMWTTLPQGCRARQSSGNHTFFTTYSRLCTNFALRLSVIKSIKNKRINHDNRLFMALQVKVQFILISLTWHDYND